MIWRRWYKATKITLLIVIILWLIGYITFYAWTYRSPTPVVYETDVNRHADATWPRRRIPRWIHQTYATHDIPIIWNATVHSVMEKNIGEFQYRRWSHSEMDAFVKEREPHLYWNTYINYTYQMQRIDAFRYVLMFHLGGIYNDMDNGCNRPFRDLLNTLEALDPDSSHLAAFPTRWVGGVRSDLIISTPGHPFFRQLISRLPSFDHYYITHFLTMMISAGPLYVSIQERFFSQSEEVVVRVLDPLVFQPMFIRKENGLTWVRSDGQILVLIKDNIRLILWSCEIFTVCLLILTLFLRYKSKPRRF